MINTMRQQKVHIYKREKSTQLKPYTEPRIVKHIFIYIYE